jgi:hypothetical protein
LREIIKQRISLIRVKTQREVTARFLARQHDTYPPYPPTYPPWSGPPACHAGFHAGIPEVGPQRKDAALKGGMAGRSPPTVGVRPGDTVVATDAWTTSRNASPCSRPLRESRPACVAPFSIIDATSSSQPSRLIRISRRRASHDTEVHILATTSLPSPSGKAGPGD